MDYSLFGPPSELINVATFFTSTETQNENTIEEDHSVDCSVSDIEEELNVLCNNPVLSAHIAKYFEGTMNLSRSTSKSTKKKLRPPEPGAYAEVVTALQSNLDGSSLLSLRHGITVLPFLRNPKNTDYNTLVQPKGLPDGDLPSGPHAVITFSVYNRVPWDTSLVIRLSQHDIPSSRYLVDLYRVIPCPYKGLPPYNTSFSPSEFVVCLEGVVYGNDNNSRMLVDHLEKVSKTKKTIRKATSCIEETQLSTLSLRIDQPYWLVHQGNCEHFIVLDQIRMAGSSKQSSAHTRNLHVSPILLDLCRACTKVPAAWAILNDTRLGETPCLVCAPCWRNMGPSEDSTVVVVPLPSYDIM